MTFEVAGTALTCLFYPLRRRSLEPSLLQDESKRITEMAGN